ncbi:hypothetical protein ACMFMG_008996 [Clarireedia jacksonii]
MVACALPQSHLLVSTMLAVGIGIRTEVHCWVWSLAGSGPLCGEIAAHTYLLTFTPQTPMPPTHERGSCKTSQGLDNYWTHLVNGTVVYLIARIAIALKCKI